MSSKMFSKLVLSLGFSAVVSHAAVTFTGVALSSVPGLSVGDVGVMLIDTNGKGFSEFSFSEGLSLTASASFGAAGDFVIPFSTTKVATQPVPSLPTLITLSGAFSNIPLTDGVSSGDRFAIIVFSESTDVTKAGDTYTVWTDASWVIPADGQNIGFNANPSGTQFRQFTASSSPFLTGVVTGEVIPEPSSFAAFAGLAVLGAVATRRRRSA